MLAVRARVSSYVAGACAHRRSVSVGWFATSPLPPRPTATFRRDGAKETSAERPSFRARVWETLQHSAELPSFRARGIRSSRVGLGASRGLSAILGIWRLVPPSVCPAQGAGSSPRPVASGAGTASRNPALGPPPPRPPPRRVPLPCKRPAPALGRMEGTRRAAPPTHLPDRPIFC